MSGGEIKFNNCNSLQIPFETHALNIPQIFFKYPRSQLRPAKREAKMLETTTTTESRSGRKDVEERRRERGDILDFEYLAYFLHTYLIYIFFR